MIKTLYKPKGSRIWRLKYRLRPEDCRITDVSQGTSDKQSAERMRTELLRELEHERAGIIPPKAAREAAQRKLTDHLDEFVAELRRCGKSEKHRANIEFRVGCLISECGWTVAKDVTPDSFQAWRRGMRNLSDKTVNDYLEAVQSLFNWMVKVDRAGSNPLARVEKVKTKEGRPKERCAMTIDQVVCLLAVAGERLTGYLMALQTGLRRSELAALKWSDLRLDEGKPFASARASTTKNGKAAAIGLVPELVKVLRELKTTITDEEGPVFATVPRIERFRRDLKKAGIPFRDAQGRSLDFHSLRKTFGTNLARAGVASRAAMELLRHSERKLTDKIYTDETMLGTWSAVNSLPNFSGLASQKLGAEGQNTAFSGTTISSGASAKKCGK